MALIFDSLAPLLLFAASVSAWHLTEEARATSRINIRFAAMLFAALATARVLGLLSPQFSIVAPAVALIATSLGGTALALGLIAFLARPVAAGVAAAALVLSLGAGLAAALSGTGVYALACQSLGVALAMAAGVRALKAGPARAVLALMAATSLLCGGMVLMDGAITYAEIFFAAALIGAAQASQPLVQAQADAEPLLLTVRMRA